jgi:hypothetical protein
MDGHTAFLIVLQNYHNTVTKETVHDLTENSDSDSQNWEESVPSSVTDLSQSSSDEGEDDPVVSGSV